MFARIRFDGDAKGMGKSLEHTFGGVVSLVSICMFQMEIHPGGDSERTEKFLEEAHIEIADKGLCA